jgi:hypothetical protein
MDEHGVDAVAAVIEEAGWSYPVSARRLVAEHALRNVELDARGNSVMLGEVVDPNEFREFESEADLKRKLAPVFERHREDRRTGLLGRVRRYLP